MNLHSVVEMVIAAGIVILAAEPVERYLGRSKNTWHRLKSHREWKRNQ